MPLHAARPALQTSWQAPPSHVSAPWHRTPQAPQCAFDVVSSKHPPGQKVVGALH